jgi:glucose/arabinose dehydrogenase
MLMSAFAVVPLFYGMLLSGSPTIASAPPTVVWPSITFTSIAGVFVQPTYVTHAGDNSGRLFVVERAGRIRIVKDGTLLQTPFLDISSRVQSGSSEQGLFSVAFPPNYAAKGYFYVDYTSRSGIGDTVVARYRITANADVADPGSEQVILTVAQPQANHNGGQLEFGPDGYLYIGMGDGGGAGDQHGTIGNGQDPSTLLGKILRIGVEPIASIGPPPPLMGFSLFMPIIANSSPYYVPATNPYARTAGYRGEIWALGLRNPWRFSFDRQTGDLYIGDVGQNAYEEIDFQAASSAGGENYGWRIWEGKHCYNPPTGCTEPYRYVAPVAEYDHGLNESIGCSVTGGYVYRGPANLAMQGIYFYGDYCSGRIWGLQRDGTVWQTEELAQPAIRPSSFGEDQAGNLYVADLASGNIYLISSP